MNATNQYEIRKGNQRGETNTGWLFSRHSFSFGRYYDPDRIAFGSLRVFNDDQVKAGHGFGEHGHDNMEIISWVMEGELEHRDSTGTHGTIKPGDVQIMTAGSGIRHSEMNASKDNPVHFLQIWITPAEQNIEPGFQQKFFDKAARLNKWQIIASHDNRGDSLLIHQDAVVSLTDVEPGKSVSFNNQENRKAYLHINSGEVEIDGQTLSAGDAITTESAGSIQITAKEKSQLMLFDVV